jgi:hypothetical protein
VSDDEAFTRLYFYGTVLMGIEPDSFWNMPFGMFIDLWTCYKQWNGIEKPKIYANIDQIIPF